MLPFQCYSLVDAVLMVFKSLVILDFYVVFLK